MLPTSPPRDAHLSIAREVREVLGLSKSVKMAVTAKVTIMDSRLRDYYGPTAKVTILNQ